MKTKRIRVFLLTGALAVVAIAIGSRSVPAGTPALESPSQVSSTSPDKVDSPIIDPNEWRTYRSLDNSFGLTIPPEWVVLDETLGTPGYCDCVNFGPNNTLSNAITIYPPGTDRALVNFDSLVDLQEAEVTRERKWGDDVAILAGVTDGTQYGLAVGTYFLTSTGFGILVLEELQGRHAGDEPMGLKYLAQLDHVLDSLVLGEG